MSEVEVKKEEEEVAEFTEIVDGKRKKVKVILNTKLRRFNNWEKRRQRHLWNMWEIVVMNREEWMLPILEKMTSFDFFFWCHERYKNPFKHPKTFTNHRWLDAYEERILDLWMQLWSYARCTPRVQKMQLICDEYFNSFIWFCYAMSSKEISDCV